MSSPAERGNLPVALVLQLELLDSSPLLKTGWGGGGSADVSKVPRDDLAQGTTVCHTHVLKLLYNTQHLHSYSLGSLQCN